MSLDKKRPFDSKQATEKHAPRGKLIALVGCDGSGKSSLTSDLIGVLQKYRPVRRYYLGLGSGDLGRKIGKIPLVGSWIESRLKQKAKATRTKGEKIPGALTALVVYAFSLIRFFHYLQMRYALNAGITVITDRYPQAEIAGQCDGPGLSAAKAGNRFVAWLVQSEARLYRRMASFHPDLILRLDVDAETAHARKPDHDIEAMRIKAAVMKQLTFGGAHMEIINATQSYEAVWDTIIHFIQPYMNDDLSDNKNSRPLQF
ncbi:nucleoside/nucleotide kinase family protein [Zymomonas mobilis]|nr:hypothetical protein [Zymomonas mobilis]MDX5949292.1 hypothetical protein [Zymomonas mobilis subsp. pomaceae]GEB89701.1 putative ATP-binding protein YghR [Zymomonas mobilis subsp. pomaceae]